MITEYDILLLLNLGAGRGPSSQRRNRAHSQSPPPVSFFQYLFYVKTARGQVQVRQRPALVQGFRHLSEKHDFLPGEYQGHALDPGDCLHAAAADSLLGRKGRERGGVHQGREEVHRGREEGQEGHHDDPGGDR